MQLIFIICEFATRNWIRGCNTVNPHYNETAPNAKMFSLYQTFSTSVYSLHADIANKPFRFTVLYPGIPYIRISYIRVYYSSSVQEITALGSGREMSRQICGLPVVATMAEPLKRRCIHTVGPGFPLLNLA